MADRRGPLSPLKDALLAWGPPADACSVGQRLAEIQDSTCQSCYALRGLFRVPKVQAAYQRRLDRFGEPGWHEAIVKLVYWQAIEMGEPSFRWFDSGDLESLGMLQAIVAVAEATPEIMHWLPSREYRVVREYLRDRAVPSNLLIRISAPMIDGSAQKISGLPTSGVHRAESDVEGYVCPARENTPANCGSCRACWDPSVEHVSYPLH